MMSKMHETRMKTKTADYREELLAVRMNQKRKETERLLSCVG